MRLKDIRKSGSDEAFVHFSSFNNGKIPSIETAISAECRNFLQIDWWVNAYVWTLDNNNMIDFVSQRPRNQNKFWSGSQMKVNWNISDIIVYLSSLNNKEFTSSASESCQMRF